MSPDDQKEFNEMKEMFRDIKTGSKLIKWTFSLILAIGGAYLMFKSIDNPTLK